MNKFLEKPQSVELGDIKVNYKPVPELKGGLVSFGDIQGFVGEYQQSLSGGDFEDWVMTLVSPKIPNDPLRLQPDNIGYYHAFDFGYTIAISKTRDGYHCEIVDSLGDIVFYHDDSDFESARGAGVCHLNLHLVSLPEDEVDVHRLTFHPINYQIYGDEPQHVESLRISLESEGQLELVEANKKGELISGNTRFRAVFYTREGWVNPFMPTLRHVFLDDGKNELMTMVNHNIYRTKTNIQKARMGFILAEKFQDEIDQIRIEEKLRRSAEVVARWLGTSASTLRRTQKLLRWLEDYEPGLQTKLESLINLSASWTETILLWARATDPLLPREGIPRVADLLLTQAAKNPEDARDKYFQEMGIVKKAEPKEESKEEPKAPAPLSYPEVLSQESSLDPVESKEESTLDGTETVPSVTQEISDEKPDKKEVSGTKPLGWQPGEEIKKLVADLEVLDSCEWQIVTGDMEADPEKSALFYYPFAKDFAKKLTDVANYLHDGDETSAIVVLNHKVIFDEEGQSFLVSLDGMFNRESTSNIGCWTGELESTLETRTQKTNVVLLALDCLSFVDACGQKVLYLNP